MVVGRELKENHISYCSLVYLFCQVKVSYIGTVFARLIVKNRSVIVSQELLFSVTKKDLEIVYFSGTGSGGQHRNKHQNCVRMYHKDSGARSTGQSNKERRSNLREAFNNLVKSQKFKIWLSEKSYDSINKINTKKEVDSAMCSENLCVEGQNEDGEWVTI